VFVQKQLLSFSFLSFISLSFLPFQTIEIKKSFMYKLVSLVLVLSFTTLDNSKHDEEDRSWIRINLLGYTPAATKVAVWCSKTDDIIKEWQLVEASTKKVVLSGKSQKSFGAYGPFKQTMRLDFSSWKKPGRYFLQAGKTFSPAFDINENV
jgi:hypothetical protein